MEYITAVFGIAVFIAIGYAFSSNRKAINWRTIAWAFGLQLVFAWLILATTPGKLIFQWLNDAFILLLHYQLAGAEMVFGDLAKNTTLGYIFAFQVLPTIIFFSALMGLLYYLGIMQKVVYVFAWIMSKTCKLSGAESLSAAANIFVGQTEAPLLIKPYVADMTQSELMCVMTGGMATVAGGVLAAYVGMLEHSFPNIAGHLMAASVMGAPAGVLFAKLIVPETETPKTFGITKIEYKDPSANILDAVATSTQTGLQLALNVAGMLIAFTALIALANGIVEALIKISLQDIFGYIFYPISWLMGIDAADLHTAGILVGEKTILNEFVAYADLTKILNADTAVLTMKSKVILSYALCGFANFSSIGIQIGGISTLAPNRRSDLSKLGFRALLAGLLSSCLRALIAGVLI